MCGHQGCQMAVAGALKFGFGALLLFWLLFETLASSRARIWVIYKVVLLEVFFRSNVAK